MKSYVYRGKSSKVVPKSSEKFVEKYKSHLGDDLELLSRISQSEE